MVIVPKGQPTIGGLNTFYVDLERLIEHCQGEFGAGCIHLRAAQRRAAIYFDRDEIVETAVEGAKEATHGASALSGLVEEARQKSYVVDVFSLDPMRVHFWASLVTAERLFGDLSAEFTDLRGLVKKMAGEKLTGFIEVVVPGTSTGALLLFDEGQIVDGSYALQEGPEQRDVSLDRLVRVCAEKGATFTVCRTVAKSARPTGSAGAASEGGRDLVQSMGRVLHTLETLIRAEKGAPAAFSTLLRAKFLSKAGEYEFLDPFAAEFHYAEGTVGYDGEADIRVVATAVGKCVSELARELNLMPALQKALQEEFAQHLQVLQEMGLAA